jgi:hypothetical protein
LHVLSRIHIAMRTDAWTVRLSIVISVIGGVLPDAISHGVILPGREGHAALAIIGAFITAAGLLWFILSYALCRRYGHAAQRSMDVVNDG